MTEYVIESTLNLAAFYVVFVVFFKKTRHYQANRMVLLFSILFSLLIPTLRISPTAIPLPKIEPSERIFQVLSIPNYLPGAESTDIAAANSFLDLSFLLTGIYVFVTLGLSGRFVFHLCVLFWKRRQSNKVTYQGHKLTLLEEKVTPFTFLNSIFVSKADYQNAGIEEELLLHEIAHKQQKHSIDVLLLELLQVFYWFNPFIYLFKQLIKANHEYLADEFVLRSGASCKDYAHKILHYSFPSKMSGFTSGFNHVLIKNRLLMLAKFNQKRPSAYSLVFFLPLMVILFLTTAFKNLDGATPGTKPDQEKGFFYADKLSWSLETKEIRLKGKIKVKFGRNDFTAEGGYSGFDPVHLLLFNGQKASPNTEIDISGLKCEVIRLTGAEAMKKYGAAGKLGAVEITTSK